MKEVEILKKTFNTLDKISIVIAFLALVIAIFAFINNYYWTLNLVFILIALNLIIMGIQHFSENKRAIFPYFIIGIALLIIFLSTTKFIS